MSENGKRGNQTEDGARESGSLDSLERVRDILFGEQSRGIDKRLGEIEGRLVEEITSLRTEVAGRMATLESYIQRELESISARWKEEQVERKQSAREFSRELADLAKTTHQRLTGVESSMNKSLAEVGRTLVSQIGDLRTEVESKLEDTARAAADQMAGLRLAKLDRGEFSTFLGELASRIAGERRDKR